MYTISTKYSAHTVYTIAKVAYFTLTDQTKYTIFNVTQTNTTTPLRRLKLTA